MFHCLVSLPLEVRFRSCWLCEVVVVDSVSIVTDGTRVSLLVANIGSLIKLDLSISSGHVIDVRVAVFLHPKLICKNAEFLLFDRFECIAYSDA
ncbi:unnamed protein product [Brassica oleracea var. botrytis]